MENIERDKQNIVDTLEPLHNVEQLPIIIEKPKRKDYMWSEQTALRCETKGDF